MTILHFRIEPDRTNEQIEADCIQRFRIHGASKEHSIYLTEALFFALDNPTFKARYGTIGMTALIEAIKTWKPE